MLSTSLPPRGPALAPFVEVDERDARRSLRLQVTRLEHALADTLISAFPFGALDEARGQAPAARQSAHVLGLAELEELRDELSARLTKARRVLEARGREQQGHRIRLEKMLLEPGKHRFETVSNKQLGEGGCGIWQVRPRLGMLGMLAGWWHVKLSSGCPLATARR